MNFCRIMFSLILLMIEDHHLKRNLILEYYNKKKFNNLMKYQERNPSI